MKFPAVHSLCRAINLAANNQATKRTTPTVKALLLLPILIAGAVQGYAQEVNKQSSDRAVKQVMESYMEAWNRHDVHAFAMVFAEDADFTNVVGMSAHGRKAIEEFHAPRFATTFRDSHQTLDDVSIRYIRPDVAAVDFHWSLRGAMGRDGKRIPLRKGLANLTMTKNEGKWLITVMHNMDLPLPSERKN